jgi:phosphoglucosamine mutase (EC 5.4.2.10)
VANTPDLSPELAFALGRAAATLARRDAGQRPVAVIGRDTRRSGPMLAAALSAGICSAGGDVVDLGVVTTPGVAFITTHMQADFGVMISASHNPAPDNGIKFFSRDGYKLPDAVEDELEALVRSTTDTMPRPTGADLGTIRTSEAEVAAYIQHLVATGSPLRGMRVVVDCGHGAAYRLAPEVLRRLGAEVIPLNTAPDGININDGCGSTHPEALQQAVLAHKAHAGIAHDGDADRCMAVDERGQLVDGDQIMSICALDLKRRGLLPGDTVVATVMSNMGLELFLREHGLRLLRTKVGDRYVLEEMLKGGYTLGGEQSGHVIFGALATTGDGILTAVQLLSVVAREGQPLSALANQWQRLPQWLENVRVSRKEGWEENPAIRAAVAEAEAALAGRGRVLVRASGTEPLIRVMLEGPDMDQLRSLAAAIGEVVRAELR